MRGRKVVVYVDNDSARHCLIRKYSPSVQSSKLISAIISLVTSLKVQLWVARVPTVANPADEPSRLEVEAAAARWNAELVEVECVPVP